MSDSDSNHPAPGRRALRSIGNQQPPRAIRVRDPCRCESQLKELRSEVSQLTKTINEMNSIVHAKLLFPHLSLVEALAEATEVTYDHVKPPKRPRKDSALYLPDIPDGFSDSTAHSLAFRRRTKATTTEQECKRALKKFQVADPHTAAPPELETIVVDIESPPVKRRPRETKAPPMAKAVMTRGDKLKTMRTTRSGRVGKK